MFQQEDINFLLTNRIPRRLLTQFMGWFSKIEQPLVRDASIGLWRLFSDLDLSEAKKTKFTSLHDCFTRELKDGARPIDPDPATSSSAPAMPSSAHAGGSQGTELLQIKGFPYTLEDLLGDAGAGGAASQRHLCDAAADVEHVPPLPRAARLPAWSASPTFQAIPGTSIRSR